MRPPAAKGLTLIEFMVAIAIAGLMIAGLMRLMAGFEGARRTARSGADLDQAGNIAMFQLDQWIRSAGTGLTNAGPYAYGCHLDAAESGQQLLPAPSGALPAPFKGLGPGFVLAPFLVDKNGTAPASGSSDALVIMSSGNNEAEVPALFASPANATSLSLVDAVAFAPNDLVLLADQQPAAGASLGPADCLVSQFASAPAPVPNSATTATLGGPWYAQAVNGRSITDYSVTGAAIDLGNPSTGAPPSFQLVGVGSDDSLYAYDLLGTSSPALQVRASDVFELHALYDVDTDGDGIADTWVSPEATGGTDYSYATLSSGTAAAAKIIKTIKAVRIGLILRTELPERAPVYPTGYVVTLFKDLGTLAYPRPLAGSELNFRYHTLEATIPLRNNAF